MRIRLFSVLPIALLILGYSGLSARPNVLLILTDDQGYGDLSLHGNPHLRTHAMDRLGRQSVRLERFYVSPVCAPTRASLLTGRYHLRTGVFGVSRREEVLEPSEVTIAELFQENGYATACFGKWHNGTVYPETPNGQGFDEFLGILGGLSQLYFNPVLNHNGEDIQYRGYITEILAGKAIAWMDRQIEEGRPFFCYVPFNAPHTPGLVEDEYWKPYYNKKVGRWESVIYGMIQVIDEQVERMLEFVEKRGISDNTIVVFLSDNGPATWRYNAGLKGKKGMLYDGGIRVPCFIRWPGKLEAGSIEHPLAHIDLLPTLADWCELRGTHSLELDGKSFAALAEDPAAPWRDRKLISFSYRSLSKIRSTGAVHTNRWTAVKQPEQWELYDRTVDFRQHTDLADKFPEVLRELSSHFEKTLETMPRLGTKAPYPLVANGPAEVVLEGQDAALPPEYKGNGIDYNYPAGISHQWISFWTSTEAYPEWTIEVVDPGQFQVSLRYCIPESNLGVEGYLEIQDERLPLEITEAYDPPPNPQPFLLEGEAVKYENKDWKEISLGRLTLKEGSTKARIILTTIPGQAAMEVKEIILRRIL